MSTIAHFSFLDDVVELENSSSSATLPSQESNYPPEMLSQKQSTGVGLSPAKKPRGSVNILNEKLVATLDKCQISDRNAVRIISALAKACGLDLNDLIINKSSINDHRKQLRKKLANRIHELFPSQKLVT